MGVVTSGDLTRLMERQEAFFDVTVESVMNREPKSITARELGATAVGMMERWRIMALPVLDESGTIVGMVHLHDLMRAGAV
jgi:arabinose-5-phosphate isomerase